LDFGVHVIKDRQVSMSAESKVKRALDKVAESGTRAKRKDCLRSCFNCKVSHDNK
jgi:hypothetical protein